MITMIDTPTHLLNWLDQLAIEQHSEHTIKAYHRDVDVFLQYCEQQKLALHQLGKSDLRQYISFCIEQKQWSNQSVQRALSAIRQFMQWLRQQDVYSQLHTPDLVIKREPRPLPGMLSAENIQQLLDQAKPPQEKAQWLWCRDKAMLELLYSSGLRLSELVGLELKAIDWSENLLRITGKGNKTRIVPFGKQAETALKAWLELRARKNLQHNFIFIAQTGQKISDRQVQNRIKVQAQRAGLSTDIHPHLLRHCFASHLLSASGELRAVQEMLGHSNLTTTQIYAHLDFDHLAKIYDQAHPRARK